MRSRLKHMSKPSEASREFEYVCSDCNEVHRGSPSFGLDKPVYYFDVLASEVDERVTITDDLCHIRTDDDADDIFCIRATLDIPIGGALEPFCWGVWVTQSEENYNRYVDTFSEDQRGETHFAWLPVDLPYYKRTNAGDNVEHLKSDVEWGKASQRPTVQIHECDHPLYLDQRDGISWDKAIEIARQMMHNAS